MIISQFIKHIYGQTIDPHSILNPEKVFPHAKTFYCWTYTHSDGTYARWRDLRTVMGPMPRFYMGFIEF